MRTNLKVILSALSVAVLLTSPVTAKSTAAPAHAAKGPSSHQPTPSWSVPRNGDDQPIDQNGNPLPGYTLGPL